MSTSPFAARTQTGFSLTEVLIGALIAGLALQASMHSLLQMQHSQIAQNQSQRLHADLRQLLGHLAQQLRQTGNHSLHLNADGQASVHAPVPPILTVSPDTAALQASYQLASDATHGGCLWHTRASLGDNNRNLYTRSQSGVLRCSNNGRSQPLMNGVRDLRWQWAVRHPQGMQWVNSAPVDTIDTSVSLVGAQVCVLLQGEPSSHAPAQVQDCSGHDLDSQGRLHALATRHIWLPALLRRPSP